MRRNLILIFIVVGLTTWLGACSDAEVVGPPQSEKDQPSKDLGKADSSIDAIFLDFAFDGELLTQSSWNPEKQIETQLLFTIGQLNGDHSLGRLDKVELSNVQTSDVEGGGTKVTYHARMPVAWGEKDDVPTAYTLIFPHDVSYSAQEAFAEKYGHDCVDWGAHDVDSGSMWYYFRPHAYACKLDEADVFETEATVTVSAINTTGKYPEYHEVWRDGRLEVVAIFGKFEHGATSNADAGISAYNEFIKTLVADLAEHAVVTEPADLPDKPGVDHPDVTITATLPDGKEVRVVALLVDGVQSPGPTFDGRYEALSSTADLISYSGHAGLGANIRALAKKGAWVTGQYVIVFMNGCDTYAYVDSDLSEAHAAVNEDDPTGTKYVDIVTNAMPAPASQGPRNILALTHGLLGFDQPLTYEAIFAKFNRSQVVLVSGEEDNVYYPGYTEGSTPEAWEGLDETGTVAKDEQVFFASPVSPAGTYRFALSGTGDADLYVRVGEAPTLETYDCRPYIPGSDEECTLELGAPASMHVMIVGWDPSSDWTLTARKIEPE